MYATATNIAKEKAWWSKSLWKKSKKSTLMNR
jgi:hypothetical protein